MSFHIRNCDVPLCHSYASLPGGNLINDHWTWVNRWFFRTFAIHITHSQGRILPRTLINLNTWDVASAYVKKYWETSKIIHNPFEKSKIKITQQLKQQSKMLSKNWNQSCFPCSRTISRLQLKQIAAATSICWKMSWSSHGVKNHMAGFIAGWVTTYPLFKTQGIPRH